MAIAEHCRRRRAKRLAQCRSQTAPLTEIAIVFPYIKEYQVLAELARGGMGNVFVGRRRGGPEHDYVAIKVMDARLYSEPEARLMMLDEAHTAMRVRHANVASVVDVGSSDEGFYLVMEYVPGCSLQQLLLCNPHERPPHLIVPILIDTLTGLHAAHTLLDPSGEPYEIVHRDVTPHNVLVSTDGVAKISDFGIAKAKDRYTATEAGLRKGKVSFMAPEQVLGEAVDAKVDVWAAGVTLFSALTGVLPFGEGMSVSTLDNVLHAQVPLASRVGLEPPACFDWVLSCALQRNPQARFHDARAFADALRCVAARHNLLGTRAQVSDWVRRSWKHRLADLAQRVQQGKERPSSAPRPLPSRVPPVPACRANPASQEPGDELTTVRHAPRANVAESRAPRRSFPHAWMRRPAREQT
jgi:serine/threonine-protein kinase